MSAHVKHLGHPVIERPTIVINYLRAIAVRDQAIREGRFVPITRPSKWGNPFSHHASSSARWRVRSREEAIACYERWLPEQPELMAALPELCGKVLGCVCMPYPCHGVVLARLADALRLLKRTPG